LRAAEPPPAVTAQAAVVGAIRKATDVNNRRINLRSGAVAAVPVAGMLALGTAVNQPVAAVTMGVGAMLVGISWRAGEGPANPPLAMMSVDALVLALATLVGTLTGRWPWLHLAVLACLCLVAGCATVLGRSGGVVGTHSMIAFIAFGRFPESIGPALSLAGLVALGGASQVVVAALVASPLAWRRQRAALAAAYRQLAEFAGYRQLAEFAGSPDAHSFGSAAALEAADTSLSAPALFADSHLSTLASVVSEGRRIRLELIVIATMMARVRREQPDTAAAVADELGTALRRLADVLELIAAAFEGQPDAAVRLQSASEQLGRWGASRSAMPALEDQLAALTGQITAAARMTIAASTAAGAGVGRARVGGRRARPSAGSRRQVEAQFAGSLQRMWLAARLNSAAGRHALRLAVVVAGTELLTQRLALPRAYWAVIAAATVLRPDFGATITRGAERLLGTTGGVVIATLIVVAIDPSGWGITAVVAVLAWATYSVFPASFALGVAGLTAVVVFLLHAVAPDSATIALDRGLDTIVGGSIALLAYLVWPTWSSRSLPRLLGQLLDAQRAYLSAVLAGLITGRAVPEPELRSLARAARVAWADAQAAVTIARGEPLRRGGDPHAAGATLAGLRRLVYGVHTVRLAAPDAGSVPHPELGPLAGGLQDATAAISETLRDTGTEVRREVGIERLRGTGVRAPSPPLPPLRALYRRIPWEQPGGPPEAVRVPLDELVDAVNTTAVAVGLELPTEH
jgi:uncharacterized membrane protein YccC